MRIDEISVDEGSKIIRSSYIQMYEFTDIRPIHRFKRSDFNSQVLNLDKETTFIIDDIVNAINDPDDELNILVICNGRQLLYVGEQTELPVEVFVIDLNVVKRGYESLMSTKQTQRKCNYTIIIALVLSFCIITNR